MPFKASADRRHHIPKQRHRIRSWASYDAALQARGSLTVWGTVEAVGRWRAEARAMPGGQRTYSDLAITTALTLHARTEDRRNTEIAIAVCILNQVLDLGRPDSVRVA